MSATVGLELLLMLLYWKYLCVLSSMLPLQTYGNPVSMTHFTSS